MSSAFPVTIRTHEASEGPGLSGGEGAASSKFVARELEILTFDTEDD